MKASVYRGYLLVLLASILAFNFVDRLALGLVLQDIKTDLGLTDTQLGLLTGIAFALFYSVLGIPIARWADRGDRVKIISITTALWSAAVALCGFATNFSHLLLMRIGVAVGEAGCVPPAHSLIADYFTRAERPRAAARYMLGGAFSVVIGYFVAGWLNQLYGWRVTFQVLGVPGLILALLAWVTLREPRRATGVPAVQAAPASPPPSVKEVAVALWSNRTFRQLLAYFAVASFFNYGIQQWKPAFFIRSFGLKTGELGTWFTVIYGIGGVLGTYLGGEWAARRAVQNEGRQLRVMALVWGCFALVSALIYLSTNMYVAFALIGLTTLGNGAISGPLLAMIQTLVRDRMRATSIALLYLCGNLIGMGLGPLAAGMLSDGLRPIFGEESLRYSLLALSPGYLWGAWHLWRASRTVAHDVAAVHAQGTEVTGGSADVVVADGGQPGTGVSRGAA